MPTNMDDFPPVPPSTESDPSTDHDSDERCRCSPYPHTHAVHTRRTGPIAVQEDASLAPDAVALRLPDQAVVLVGLGIDKDMLDGSQSENTARLSVAKRREPHPPLPHELNRLKLAEPGPPEQRETQLWPPIGYTKEHAPEPRRIVPRDHPSSRPGILIIDDPHDPGNRPLTPEQRANVERWYKQAPLPGLPDLDSVERKMSPMKSADLLKTINTPLTVKTLDPLSPDMEAKIKSHIDQIKAVYPKPPIIIDSDAPPAVIVPSQTALRTGQNLNGDEVTQEMVDELFEVYNRHTNYTGPGPTAPPPSVPLPSGLDRRFLPSGLNPDHCLNCGRTSDEHGVTDGECPSVSAAMAIKLMELGDTPITGNGFVACCKRVLAGTASEADRMRCLEVWKARESKPQKCGPCTLLNGQTEHIHVCLPGSSACQCGKHVYPPRSK